MPDAPVSPTTLLAVAAYVRSTPDSVATFVTTLSDGTRVQGKGTLYNGALFGVLDDKRVLHATGAGWGPKTVLPASTQCAALADAIAEAVEIQRLDEPAEIDTL